MKFLRRPDPSAMLRTCLDTKTRIDIALAAYLSQGVYGTITSLAQSYLGTGHWSLVIGY